MKEKERCRPMELIFAQGETIDQDGEVWGRPTLAIEQGARGLTVDLCAELGDDGNGNQRQVTIEIPLADLHEALAFLTHAND